MEVDAVIIPLCPRRCQEKQRLTGGAANDTMKKIGRDCPEGGRHVNDGFWCCAAAALLFALFGLLFACLGERAARLVSGFNDFPAEKQALYDRSRLVRDMRRDFFRWALVLCAGALLAQWLSPWCALAGWAAWAVLFLRSVHFDADKAFEKYRIRP